MFIFFTINDTTGEWGRCFRLRVQKFENEESVKSRCIDPVSLDFVLSYHRHSYHYYVVADMLEYIKTHLELVMQSKEILLPRRLGVETQPNPLVKEMFEQLKVLVGRIGPTGKQAFKPFIRTSSRDLWEINLLFR